MILYFIPVHRHVEDSAWVHDREHANNSKTLHNINIILWLITIIYVLYYLYKRFIIPIYIPLLVLITFILILSSKENLNYSKIKTITFILGLFIIIFSETTIRLISETILKNFLISLMPLALLFTLYLTFFSKTNHKYKASWKPI